MPESFGRYQLIRKLAVGGMGQVFLARQQGPVGFEKLVVLKQLLPHLCEEQEFVNMFFDEARIAANLNHPNVAQIYDLGEVDGRHFIAMEYVYGASLKDTQAKAQGKIPIGLLCRIVADAAAGLDHAHGARTPDGKPLGLIHRDVSPQNILIGFNGSVKLIDFGVAKAAGKITHTRTGVIRGKYPYMSPEQARGQDLDRRSDVFALGTVFFEALTHSRLFKRQGEAATLRAVANARVPPPSSLTKGIPKPLDAIVLRALAKRREDRFSSAGEFQSAIEAFLSHQKLQATPQKLATYMDELFRAEVDEKSEITILEPEPQHSGSAKKPS